MSFPISSSHSAGKPFFEVQLCHASTSPTRLGIAKHTRTSHWSHSSLVTVRGKRIRHRENNTSKTFEVHKKTKRFCPKGLSSQSCHHKLDHQPLPLCRKTMKQTASGFLSFRLRWKYVRTHLFPDGGTQNLRPIIIRRLHGGLGGRKNTPPTTNCGSHRCCEPLQTNVQCRVAERQTDELGLNVCFWRNV